MVLVNFKSYAGVQEIGPFHKSFTSIVGPNGSGKSNIIDSLLFVFGYKAKQMRQGKVSELIHSSVQGQTLENCRVEVHFVEIMDLDGQDAYSVIPNSTLIVSRTAYRNNTSKYFINGVSSSFTEVTSLLRSRGIDLDHKRFLILQGEVESISQMKPKAQNEHEEGLLEYLEDIIGTSVFKKPIEDAREELELLNETRTEKLKRFKTVEKEIDDLKGEKEEAEKYIQQENDLIRKKNIQFQLQINECSHILETLEEEKKLATTKLENERKQIGELGKELNNYEKNFKKEMNNYEKVAEETKKVNQELSKFDREDIRLQETRKHLKQKLKKLVKQQEQNKKLLSEKSSSINSYKSNMEKKMDEIQKLQLSLEKEEKELEKIRISLKGKTDVYYAEIEKKQQELSPWLDKINHNESTLEIAQSKYKILLDSSQKGEKEINDAVMILKEYHNRLTEKDSQISRNSLKIKEYGENIVSTTNNIKHLSMQEIKMKEAFNSISQKTVEAKIALQVNQNRGDVIKSLLKEKSCGRILGIHDRLGSLGIIDEKYDIAVSTAAGGALNEIVVETVKTAEDCIKFLRNHQLGRGVFSVLEKLPNYDFKRISTPENVPRLFDLIKPKDAMFAPAFYSAVQNTLVAKDLEQAKRIAYGEKRWRVVTLQGELIDKSGTMTGGGNRIVKGLMSSSFSSADISPKEFEDLEKLQNQSKMDLKSLQDKKQMLQNELHEKENIIPELKLEIQKLEIDRDSIIKQIKSQESHIHEMRVNAKTDENELREMKSLEKEIIQLQKKHAELQKSSKSLEDSIQEMQQKILDVGGIKLRSQKSKVDGIKDQIDLLITANQKLEQSENRDTKEVQKLTSAIERNSEEIEKLQVLLEENTTTIKEKTEAAMELRKTCEEAKEILRESKEEMESCKMKLMECRELVNKHQQDEIDLSSSLEEINRKAKETKSRMHQWNSDLKILKLQKLNDNDEIEKLEEYSEEGLASFCKTKLSEEIHGLEGKLEISRPNLGVLAEYKQKHSIFVQRKEDLEQHSSLRDQKKEEWDSLRKERLEKFMTGFSSISQKLKEMYQMITLGGNAELELVDSLDPFSEGILFSVMPPKKSWKNIANLSGGEKTLSSLALVFALHHYKPTPLYVMDEIDAALDFRNVSIIANYIKERTQNAQFIIISLRNNMFELADRLVGIYKTNHCTKSISVEPHKMISPSPLR